MNDITIDDVNRAIQHWYPTVCIFHDAENRYFFIYSDHPMIRLWVAGLHTTGIYVAELHHMTIPEWVDAVRQLFENPANDWGRE